MSMDREQYEAELDRLSRRLVERLGRPDRVIEQWLVREYGRGERSF